MPQPARLAGVRVLLSDGSGLTARQTATALALQGHEVHALAAGSLPLTRFTRHVRHVHRVAPYGTDPERWLTDALRISDEHRIDLLFPTQEQAFLLSRATDRIRAAGLRTVVPPFPAIRRVQDKVGAVQALDEYSVLQPRSVVARSEAELLATERLPVWVKPAIGTASTGVARVEPREDLERVATRLERDGTLGRTGVVVQDHQPGELVMVQTVFDRGRLVAFHANRRVRVGQRGGASVKESVALPELREPLVRLGAGLEWHGALSFDAVVGPDGPLVIDVNPRLVEPGNARRSGTDLVGVLVRLAGDEAVDALPDGRPGVRTHQLLIGVLGAAEQDGRRRDVLAELLSGTLHRGDYHASTEELTPVKGDPRAVVPLIAVGAATLVWPGAARWFGSGAVAGYALTTDAWEQIIDDAR